MRRLILSTLFIALCLPVASAQESGTVENITLPSAPVRYDTDMPSAEFHRGRRAALLKRLPDDGVAVIFSAPVRNRDNDVDFEYRQSSDLYYLTGMTEPGTVLILAPGGIEEGGMTVTELLFVPPRDPNTESWQGRRLGPERAGSVLGFDHVVSTELFESIMDDLAKRDGLRFFHQSLPDAVDPASVLGRQIAAFGRTANPLVLKTRDRMSAMAARYLLSVNNDDQFARLKAFIGRVPADDFETPLLQEARQAFVNSVRLDEWLSWRRDNIDNEYANFGLITAALYELRSVKAPEELALMQRAIDITVAAQKEAMKSIEPGMYEYEIEALIEYVFRRNGSEYPGFPTIVASGENSVILHHQSNRRQMSAEDVVVMDIGAEYHGYSGDVTRTVPVSGTFTPEQKAIYEIVLEAQQAGIAETRANAPFDAPHQAAADVIANRLMELGILQDARQVRRFFSHGTSHYLGLSVHDVGSRGPLVPGTVITVEPGIYIRPSNDVESKWWNIGVRIEDDILVTEGDPVNMSIAAPRTVDEIEELMRERGIGNRTEGVIEVRTKSS